MLRFLWGVFALSISIMGGIFGYQGAQYFLDSPTVSRFLHPPVNAPVPSSMVLPTYYEILVNVAFVLAGILVGWLLASIAFRHLVRLGSSLGKIPPNDILAGIAGCVVALVLTWLVSYMILQIPYIGVPLLFAVGITLCFLGVNLMMGIKSELGMLLRHGVQETIPPEQVKILDTNVIIDGRIADISRAGFLEGQIYVPGFVLDELQHIADSSDSLKRARGRRGLDILNAMQKEQQLLVRTFDGTYDENEEVDARLVTLAKKMKGCIVTNDSNLNKVAELQGVKVLNVNELANAMKPVVLPGEEMGVAIIKEGKELNQGIGYLDDGTMIVVEGARKYIGETIPVIVTSVLQTVAGKMIFGNAKSGMMEEDDILDRNVRTYSGSRPRKKI